MAAGPTFTDLLVSREHRFSLGIVEATGQPYLSIPVGNPWVDYEEYYRIDPAMFDGFMTDPDSARSLAERCRQRLEDGRLILRPGGARGTAT